MLRVCSTLQIVRIVNIHGRVSIIPFSFVFILRAPKREEVVNFDFKKIGGNSMSTFQADSFNA